VSIRHPAYAADGTLYFLADWTDWSVLYRLDNAALPEIVFTQEVEVQEFVLEDEDHALVSYRKDGSSYLARVSLQTGDMDIIGESFSSLGSLTSIDDGVYFIASTPHTNSAIYRLQDNLVSLVYQPDGPTVDQGFLSAPQPIAFPTGDEEQAYGFFYPPKNADFQGPEGTLPPLIVIVHGGPVGATNSSLSPRTQFWTSRGFAVFDVNHRGSTGYGRSFRKKLYPNWGIVDVEDVANGAKWLSEQGYVDADKLAIRGGSAGGYTVLAAVAFRNVFKAGTSYFGISDLEVLARDTHKFESRYLDQLIGSYPESKEIYEQRSPINAVDKIQVPLLLLQGLDDKVVPPNQSELIFDALKKNAVPTAFITFEGEGHGFRKPANNIKALNAELDFYGQVFEFEPAGDTERVELIR
jgi:dipeptidyl aminopeptidase/acylaminoacyl peptidase